MDIKKILVATDFSECSDEALRQASKLARAYQAQLLIAHVDESGHFADAGFSGWPVSDKGSPPHDRLRAVTPAAPVAFTRHMLSGSPAHQIAEFAEANHADLIVIGTHGRKGLGRLVLGSVAEKLVRQASCPVLTVRPSQGTLTEEDALEVSGVGKKER